jgi:hypothetical protein
LPEGSTLSTYVRFKRLDASLAADRTFSLDEIIAINAAVEATGPVPEDSEYAPGRTLWHALYDIDDRSLSVRFYLRDEGGIDAEGSAEVVYSDYFEFGLSPDGSGD